MDNEKLISPYIESQFPFHYRENYPQFVEFIRVYYRWLEQQTQAIGHTRRLLEYRDVDQTQEDYLQYFKNKYMPYLKFVTNTDKRILVKHVQDLYRSKGTERGIDLFFKLVYGVNADVYYPGTDLFRLSDNSWIKRNYLELGHIELINDFIGKKIIGTRSGATAFAERFVQKKVGNTYVNLLFISNIVGTFSYNERITYEGLEDNEKSRPRIIGSLSRLDVTSGSKDFNIGDIVSVESEKGHGALARVANVFNTSGVIDFILEDGGWGYTSNSQVYVSDKVLTLQNVVTDYVVNNPDKAPYRASPFFTLEELYQPLANLNYSFNTSLQSVLVQKPSAAWFQNGQVLYQGDGTSVVARGTVISNSAVNTSSQNLVISIAKNINGITDFYITGGSYGNIYVSTTTTTNSTILDANTSTNTATIEVGTVLTSYNSTGGVISTVEIVNTDIVTDKNGNLFVYILSGNAQTNTYFWSSSNTFSINSTAYVDRKATGNVVGVSNTFTLYISNSTSLFTSNQKLVQRRTYSGGYDISAIGTIRGITYTGNSAVVNLVDSSGVFRPTVNVYMTYANGQETESHAYLNSFDALVGIANVTNDFVSIGNNRVFARGFTYDSNGVMIIYGSNSVANLTALSSGKNATFEVSNTLAYAETYSLYTDFLGANNEANVPYMSLGISNSAWYFPKNQAGNSAFIIGDVLNDINGYVGGITKLTAVNPGEDYNVSPFVMVREPFIAGFNKKNYVITFSNLSGNFILGEQITQDNGAVGLITAIEITNIYKMYVTRQTLTIDFTQNQEITGQSTGATATIVGLQEDDTKDVIGMNADVNANVVTANGVVNTLEILASGYGFENDENATFLSEDGMRAGTAKVKLIKQGVTDGTFMDASSFLSDNKYLFDGDYFQEYSYDIKTSIPRDAYEDNFNETMHVAGTKMFSTFVHTALNDMRLSISLPESTANLIANTA